MFKDYWELRDIVKRIIPRRTLLKPLTEAIGLVQEKGRKSNYREFDIKEGKLLKQERLLNKEEVKTFLEISLRASACPMPLNLDVWDGLACPYGCKYCFADAFRASLYTSFFDNAKSVGLRHCSPSYYKTELNKILSVRGSDPHDVTGDVKKAISMEIPMRMGIRFEDFTGAEKKKGISLEMLEYLKEEAYPVMINTKSDLLATDPYLRALSENKGKTAIHITMITSNEDLLNRIEPGAPSFERRIEAARYLSGAGVRVVARIEPHLPMIADDPEDIEEYMVALELAGVKHITFDTYSYSANLPGIRRAFYLKGFDFDRMFLLSSDSQALGSLLLSEYMKLFRKRGFNCSTFDMGNVPSNDDAICCEVGDWFGNGYAGCKGFNWGSVVGIVRFLRQQAHQKTPWSQFKTFVEEAGGFLSESLEKEVHGLWNLEGNPAYHPNWATGFKIVGRNEDGLIWAWDPDAIDFRKELLKRIV